MSAREVIAWTMKSLGAFDPTREADEVLVALHAAGYRILGPGELDVETVEKCAQVAERMLRFADTTSEADIAISEAIRAIGRKA